MSSGRKSMAAILCEGSFQDNPEVREFLFRGTARLAGKRLRVAMILPRAIAVVVSYLRRN